jgi:hypothetical protein
MNQARHLLALSACLLAALCAAGFSSTPAFANWMVEGKTVVEPIEVEAENDGEEFGFAVPSLNFQLVFKNIVYDKVSLLEGGKTAESFLFTEGAAYMISPKILLKNCTPGNLAFDAQGSLLLHNGNTYLRFENLPEQPLTITSYAEGCPIGNVKVVGSVVLEDSSGSFSNEAVSHLVKTAPTSLFPSKLSFGTREMSFLGNWKVKLKGKEAGKKWGGTI